MSGSQLTHVVAFTLNPDVSRDDPRAQVAAAITGGHPATIPEIATWVCGWDTGRRPDSADFLVVSTFDTPGDYDIFQVHPDHQRGKNAWKQIATWAVADILPGVSERP
ncbi:Dabb family protein [Dermacoccus barathri]|uniref:Stress-response A/B barrel domain-containing protein n=1 Tax=Dermacoccus barathri TaxID=322601 RepID=A0ABN2BYG6_9MICO